jgi:hypothetical protein
MLDISIDKVTWGKYPIPFVRQSWLIMRNHLYPFVLMHSWFAVR